jgi:NO-binding membrane sensor protein with MHYT domain
MESNGTPRTVSHASRNRVWQDSVAEGLLAAAVALIALTGVDSYVLRFNIWIASIVPAYDPMVTMLVLIVAVLAALVLASVRFKIAARRATEGNRALQPARPRRARLWSRFPYPGS